MDSNQKLSPLIPAVASGIIWGSGELINKQLIKAVFFFALQIALVAIELLTGQYFTGSGSYNIRENGGFFIKGIWGIITLGTQPRKMTLAGLTGGDHSIVLLINGIIALLVCLIFIAVYIWNIRDAYNTCKEYNNTQVRLSTRNYLKKLWDSMFHYIVLLPAIGLLIMFILMPILFSLLVAFTNYTKSNMPPTNLVSWVGLKNFNNLAVLPIWSSTFIGVFIWTIVWAVLSTATCFFGGFFQAVMVNNRRVKLKRFWRGIYILPWAIPGFISLLVFRSIFNGQFGPLSQFFLDIGLTSTRISWFSDSNNPGLARATLLVVNLWLGFPYFMALMSGVMTGLSEEVFEAARIDGAKPRQEFWKITFPLVLQATAPLLIMSFAGNFNNFGVIYFFTEGGPANPNYQFAGYTDILISWIYKLTRDQQMYNMASVMSILIFMIVGSISLINLRRTRAFKEE